MHTVLHLYTIRKDNAAGVNNIVGTIYRFLTTSRLQNQLPKRLIVLLETYSRKNENRYIMSYPKQLVRLRVFDIFDVGFLPVSHTNENLEEYFSQTSDNLHHHDAIALQDIHPELRHANNGTPNVCLFERVANFQSFVTLKDALIV